MKLFPFLLLSVNLVAGLPIAGDIVGDDPLVPRPIGDRPVTDRPAEPRPVEPRPVEPRPIGTRPIGPKSVTPSLERRHDTTEGDYLVELDSEHKPEHFHAFMKASNIGYKIGQILHHQTFHTISFWLVDKSAWETVQAWKGAKNANEWKPFPGK